MDFWASRVHSAKHYVSAVQVAPLNNSYNHVIGNDMEVEDDPRAWFPCPFCYVDIEVHVLCSHLQEEHCFDFKNAVCPICAANLGKNAIEHFMLQHAHSVKRRRKSQKPGSNNLMMLVKDMRERNSFIASNPMTGRGNMHANAPDPLLSNFICNISLSDSKSNQEDELPNHAVSTTSDKQSSKSLMLDEAQEQNYEERSQKAAFVQQLIISTIF